MGFKKFYQAHQFAQLSLNELIMSRYDFFFQFLFHFMLNAGKLSILIGHRPYKSETEIELPLAAEMSSNEHNEPNELN